MTEINKLKEAIEKSKKIGVVSHVNPDGDNLGSLTALSESLRLFGKEVHSIFVDKLPYNLEFLHGIEHLSDNLELQPDILFILDSSSEERLGSAVSIMENSDLVVNIDHHISNSIIGDYNFVDIKSSSTGEVLFDLLKKLGLPIDVNVAESLFTSISADSGSFRYDSVRKETFLAAAELLDYGIDVGKITKNLYSSNRVSKVKMLSLALDRMQFSHDNRVAYTYVLREDYGNLNAQAADVEGIVEYIRDIDEVEISLFFKQTRFGWKVSTRSKSIYDMTELAGKFGGGGHIRASGFSLEEMSVDEAIKIVLEQI